MNPDSDKPRELGPERLAGNGLDPHQYDSGDAAILAMLTESEADNVDLAITWRADAYEVWSRRGMIRFKRFADARGTLSFQVVEQIGENPIANQDPFLVSTIADELDAAARSGNHTDDPNRAYFEPHVLSHPYAYERIAQLFDSPRAPDLVVSPKAYAWGIQPGQHGALDVVQCRAPLIFSGPGVRRGLFKLNARHVDVAPTIARIAGMPKIAGFDASGAPAQVYLKRQDGRPLDEIIDDNAERPRRVYLILLDGQTHSELRHQLDNNPAAIPNLAGLVARGAMLSHGSIVNFPSITWPSHSTILTGAWCGHHDVVNPTFHLREHRETVPIQGNIYDGERYLSPDVETLYEAFKRAGGEGTLTASIHEPQGRGAEHAVFERRIVGDKARLKALTAEMASDVSPRWADDNIPAMTREEIVDIRGMAQLIALLEHCGDNGKAPTFVAHEFVLTDGAGHDYGPHHEGTREALYRTDKRIGAVLELVPRARPARFDAVRRDVGPWDGGATGRTQSKSAARCTACGNRGRVCRGDDLSARSARRNRARPRSPQPRRHRARQRRAAGRRASPTRRRPRHAPRPRQRSHRRNAHIRKRPRRIRNAGGSFRRRTNGKRRAESLQPAHPARRRHLARKRHPPNPLPKSESIEANGKPKSICGSGEPSISTPKPESEMSSSTFRDFFIR